MQTPDVLSLIEIGRKEPACLVRQHWIDADCMMPAQMPINDFIGDR